jgi:hypothetical protein
MLEDGLSMVSCLLEFCSRSRFDSLDFVHSPVRSFVRSFVRQSFLFLF